MWAKEIKVEYRAVGNRCAVVFEDLNLPCSVQDSLQILERLGLELVDVDLVLIARSVMGTSKFLLKATQDMAPAVCDCSGFIKWIYGQKGIWLPRRSVQQRNMGTPANPCSLCAGDLLFTEGARYNFTSDDGEKIGHVAMASESGKVIEMTYKAGTVTEVSLCDLLSRRSLRGVRRLIPESRKLYTFITPSKFEVESSDDFRWIIRRELIR